MTADNLLALADRVEAASGPDRDLDKAIARAIGFFAGTRASYDLQLNLIPMFTASLDAAMTLVQDNPYNTGERFQVEHWTTNGVHAVHVRASAWVSGARRVFAATPAMALTAAALRARSLALQPGGE